MPVSKAQQRAVTKYVKNRYDRFGLTMPKGRLDEIKAVASAQGESVNGFINRAISETMDRDTLPPEVIFGRAVDVIAEHYEASPWNVLDELKGLEDKEQTIEGGEHHD